LKFVWSLVLGAWCFNLPAASFETYFRDGVHAYNSSNYLVAAEAFQKSAALKPAAGTLQNLGNADWQRGQPGPAIVAWERAAWLDPFNNAARDDLRFARKNAQVEAPELAWYEVVSTWLPANWWAAIAGTSFWAAVGMVMLPGILRIRKAGWHQAVAAFGVMVFLLSLPAHAGIYSRSRIGFVLEKSTPLRLTPTQDAQMVTRLAAGEPVRCERQRGNYWLVHNPRARGWIEQDQCGLVCPK
jgi:tetratricopeptide (TPR) repeat protein